MLKPPIPYRCGLLRLQGDFNVVSLYSKASRVLGRPLTWRFSLAEPTFDFAFAPLRQNGE